MGEQRFEPWQSPRLDPSNTARAGPCWWDTDSWCPVRALVAPHLAQRLEQKMSTRSSSRSFVALVFLFDTILNTPSLHFSLRRSYITGAAVPSDHLLTGTRKIEMGSGSLGEPPIMGELGRFAPQVSASFAGA